MLISHWLFKNKNDISLNLKSGISNIVITRRQEPLFLATVNIIFPKIHEIGRQPSSSFFSEYLIFGAKIPGRWLAQIHVAT